MATDSSITTVIKDAPSPHTNTVTVTNDHSFCLSQRNAKTMGVHVQSNESDVDSKIDSTSVFMDELEDILGSDSGV